MKKIILVISLLVFCQFAFSERYVQPTFYDNQEEVLIQGGSVILSNKQNGVLMYQTCKTIRYRRGNFMFAISNDTDRPFNFHFDDLRVTDQWGRRVRVVPKRELIKDKKQQRDGKLFLSGAGFCLDTINANEAGRVDRISYTRSREHAHLRSNGSNGWVNETFDRRGSSVTHETIHSEALRRQELRAARIEEAMRRDAIESEYERWNYGLSNFYFESNTIFPGERYQANFQVEIPSHVEKDLQYLIFTYHVGGEEHTFSFYCGMEKTKWYRFGF